MTSTLEVEQGDATAHVIREAWQEVLAEAGSPGSEANALVAEQQADPAALAAAPLDVEEREGDFGVTLLVTVGAPVTVHILKSLWDDLVRPRVREKFNRDAGPVVE